MTDQPEPTHGCTINGESAMPILVADYNQLITRATEAEARAEKAQAALEAVRQLHAPNERGNCSNRCYTSGMAPAPSPCPTIQALDEPPGPAPAPAATDTELRRQLEAAIAALGKSETELAALRQVARGYCPHCGRGDAAPTVADWEQQKTRADQAEDLLRIAHDTSNQSERERARAVQRAEQAEAKVADYENRITWHTTCQACARVLDSSIRETERAERAEAALARVQALADQWVKAGPPPLGTPVSRWWDTRLVELGQTLNPAADG